MDNFVNSTSNYLELKDLKNLKINKIRPNIGQKYLNFFLKNSTNNFDKLINTNKKKVLLN